MLENKADMDSIINDRYRSSTIKTDKNTTYNFRLKVKHRLSAAIKMIPSNAIINKGRCGVGGTYLEIIAKRDSIIVVPTNAIIDDKCYINGKLRPNYFVVRGTFKPIDYLALKEFVTSNAINKKIFTTPEGLQKIIRCGAEESDIYHNWFLLFDEAHTPISDSYRKGILSAFQYFFDFKNKALISATPYRFSDIRFKDFDIYNIRFRGMTRLSRGYVDKIQVINTNDVLTALHSKLINVKSFSGRVHVFLNSVKEIFNIITRAQLADYSVYCRYDKSNMIKLNQLRCKLFDKPEEKNYSKFNFYTSKYFEGWDLEDEDATIIIVSDFEASTLNSGVSNKCVQAAGRNRFKSKHIIHLTNSRNLREFKQFEELESGMLITMKNTISKFNDHLKDSRIQGFEHDLRFESVALQYADFNEITEIAEANSFKSDQLINLEYSSQQFNHVDFIVKAWKDAFYKVTQVDLVVPPLPSNIANRNKTEKVRATLEFLDALELRDGIEPEEYRSLIQTLPFETDEIIDAYQEIGGERMKKLGYVMKFIDKEVIESKNDKAVELMKKHYLAEWGTEFKFREELKGILQRLFIKYNYRNSTTGKVVNATGACIRKLFGKQAITDRSGKRNGFRIEVE